MDSACTFCCERKVPDPCIKLWGPKKSGALELSRTVKQAAIEVSRPVTIYDPSIDPKDVMSLQYSYSEVFQGRDNKTERRLFQIFPSVYGASIVHLGLRHAMLSYVLRDRGCEAEYLKHDIYANREIQRKLAHPNSLDEGDLFVSLLLAASAGTKGDKEVVTAHRCGFLAILEVLFKCVGGDICKYELSVFWPFARDILNVLDGPNHSFASQCSHILNVSLNQVKEYTESLYHVPWTETNDLLLICLQAFAVERERDELKHLFRPQIEAHRGNPCTFSDSMFAQPSFSFQKPKELDRIEEYVNCHQFLLKSLILLESPVDSFSNPVKDAILSISPSLSRMVEISVKSHLNVLLRTILDAPTIADGLSSSKAILEIYSVSFLLERFGGAMFIKFINRVAVESGVAGFDDVLEYWNYLAPRAGRMFYESINLLRFSSSLRVGSEWGRLIRYSNSRGLGPKGCALLLRQLYAVHGIEFLENLLFSFPGLDTELYTWDEVRTFQPQLETSWNGGTRSWWK